MASSQLSKRRLELAKARDDNDKAQEGVEAGPQAIVRLGQILDTTTSEIQS